MKRMLLSIAMLLAVPAAAQVHVITESPHADNPLAMPDLSENAPLSPPIRLSVMQASKEPAGDKDYQPEVGQAGKDVIWVPTPDDLVKAMLTTAQVKPGDYVVDLGSGDGKIAIAAARDFGAKARGIEYNPEMVALARRNAQRAGVAGRVTFEQADIFQTDFSNASVVTLYLLPSLNLKLRPIILKMRPGTRIVSNSFTMGEWEPEKTISTDGSSGYFWIVPANVAGRWAFEVGNDRFATELGQQFQYVTTANGAPIKSGKLRGAAIELVRSDGVTLSGEVKGDQMLGRGWMATRIKPAG